MFLSISGRPFACLLAASAMLVAGCHANGAGNSLWGGGTARVPPPMTSSYGKAASYYGRAPQATNPPPAVPATGSRPPTTTGAGLPPAPPAYSTSPIPAVPPTYLSTPARVDSVIQPASAQEPTFSSSTVPGNSLRWGTR